MLDMLDVNMKRSMKRSMISSLVMSPLFFLIVVLVPTQVVRANLEGDALDAFSRYLSDPNGMLRSWDKQYVDPCTWLHVTCDGENRVIRLDMGGAGLSGPLAPELGLLSHLQYLELHMNDLSGPIPIELGNLAALVSLDLYENNLTGPIPDTLGQLSNLQFLRVNNNSLSGPIPVSLTAITRLQVLDLSHNNLSGAVPTNGSFPLFTPLSFTGNDLLCGPVLGRPCPGQPPFPPPPPNTLASPPNQETIEIDRKVIILASTISAVVLMCAIAGITLIISRKQKHSGHILRDSKVADAEVREV